MKAYLVNKYKRPMEIADAPEPTIGDHDVLVDIHAAGVNLLDAKIRDAVFKLLLPYKTPFILGHDLAIKPASLSMAEAASAPLVALTAWQALIEQANLQPGQKVLIHAGSGGVGTYAIQLAKHLGATVATTTGTSNVDWVRDLGADIVIDYRTQDFETVIHDYDVVLDSQSKDTLTKSLRVLKPGGIAIGIAGPPDPDFAREQGLRLPLRLVMTLLSLKTRRAARRHGVRYSFLFMRASGPQLDEITKLIDSGGLRPIVDQTYPFDEAPQALAHVEGGRTKGKVVITVV